MSAPSEADLPLAARLPVPDYPSQTPGLSPFPTPAEVQRRQAGYALIDLWMQFLNPLLDTFESGRNALDRGLADVLLLGARRALAVYHLFRLAGLDEHRRGTVLSDRFLALEKAGDWDRHTKAWLFDDCSQYGRAKERLEDAARCLWGQDSVVDGWAHVALQVPPTSRRPARSTADGQARAASEDTGSDWGRALHGQYALAFARAGVPLFADFPVSTQFTADVSTLAKLLNQTRSGQRFDAVDVTNTAVANQGGLFYSLFPRQDFVSGFAQEIGPAAQLVSLVKLRVFSFADGRSTYRVRVVPIVLTKELDSELVLDWLRRIGRPVAEEVETTSSDERENARKLRDRQAAAGLDLIGFMLARRFMDYVNQRVPDLFDGQLLKEDPEFTAVAMSPTIDRMASDCFDSLKELASGATEVLPSAKFDLAEGWESGRDMLTVGDRSKRSGNDDPPEFLQVVLDALPKAVGEFEDFVTLTQLQEELKRLGRSFTIYDLSVALDILNDLGFAVPVLTCRDGQAVRGYRQGEQAGRIKTRMPGVYSAYDESYWNHDEEPIFEWLGFDR
ncbi:MAG: hypothetical protein LBJ44_07850 [Propionibacteriaceae bacterium]|nr:hypothetical protein [Propionibacteriaceae bacterium]